MGVSVLQGLREHRGHFGGIPLPERATTLPVGERHSGNEFHYQHRLRMFNRHFMNRDNVRVRKS